MAYPKVNWITNGQDWSDYRPAISSDGKTILFERSAPMHTTVLYRLVIDGGKDPAPFLPRLAGTQTRPGWCWKNNVIAFNVSDDNPVSIYTVGGSGNNPAKVSKSNDLLYPQWDASGESLTVMNKTNSAKPFTCVIDKNGVILQPNVNGADSKGNQMLGGMPAVNPLHGDHIAFAGQPPWGSRYNQDENYIFLNHRDGTKYTSSPMEPGASIDKFDPLFQGRAPAWSPNGRYIVFESDRPDRKGRYALFLFDTRNPDKAAVQLTDPKANPAQHAKWYPDGWCLIFCANPPLYPNNTAIAYIVISQYVS